MKHIQNRIKIAALSVDLKECESQERNQHIAEYNIGWVWTGERIPIHDSTKIPIFKKKNWADMVSCNPTPVVSGNQFGGNYAKLNVGMD